MTARHALEGGESVPRGHEADLMKLGEVAFRSDGVTGAQLAGFDALADPALDSLVRGQAVAVLRRHSLSRTGLDLLCGHMDGTNFFSKQERFRFHFSSKPRKSVESVLEPVVL